MRKVFFVIFCLTLFFPGISLKSSQDSPRKTFQVFLESMNKFYKEKDQNSLKRAVECLDISKLKGNPQVQGQNAAQKLLEVFDRTELIILKNIPTNVSDSFYIFRKNNSGTIALTKNSQGKWLFNSETISSLDKQLKAVKNNSFVDQSFAHRNTQTKIKLAWVKKLPSIFHQKVFALALWQYIGLFVLLVIGIIIEKLILNFSRSLVLRFLRKQDFSIAEKSVEKLQRPMSLSVLSLIVLNLLEWLTLPLAFNNILLFFANGILAIGLIWVGFVCTEIGEQIFKEITTKTENKIDDLLVPIIARALKILIFIMPPHGFRCHKYFGWFGYWWSSLCFSCERHP